jgi:murein DD-endopeptidase MepM/ murein hydrolase activator NlpD
VTLRVWLVFLIAVVAVATGGIVALSTAGVFDREPSIGRSPPPGTVPPPGTMPPPISTPEPRPTAAQSSSVPRAAPNYSFPVQGCRADVSQSHHDYPASDIFAKVGCRFVSPVDGRVDEVTRVDSWDPETNLGRDRGGLSVSVVGADGVRYYGSHLSSIELGIRPGVTVRAGQRLGLTGNTGSARGTQPHLHFGISWPTSADKWWVRRGAVPPQSFLNSWHQGSQLSPAKLVTKTKRSYGVDHGCRLYC